MVYKVGKRSFCCSVSTQNGISVDHVRVHGSGLVPIEACNVVMYSFHKKDLDVGLESSTDFVVITLEFVESMLDLQERTIPTGTIRRHIEHVVSHSNLIEGIYEVVLCHFDVLWTAPVDGSTTSICWILRQIVAGLTAKAIFDPDSRYKQFIASVTAFDANCA